MIEYNATDWFYGDIERLRRYSHDWAESVYDLLDYHLLEYGGVPESCDPHPLGHDRGCLSGYMECHAEPDVLVIYRVLHGHVLLVRVCTHWELYKCVFDSSRWPDPKDEAEEIRAHGLTESQVRAGILA
ncbi:type II toxin-antitoxin system YafQ family toxin [Bifidobacterium sp. UTBIF-78]|uniref:type II toxin-antitoxin system YafQ family toxin n=1 Tax=Bifidobacterium sp. UTBIF-78 TaxID=1465263 RepID=UPI00112D970D|nr:type II toxin-antitoxin system YafQ family toxin [Bifidobacterium sp. UTBIF-78]